MPSEDVVFLRRKWKKDNADLRKDLLIKGNSYENSINFVDVLVEIKDIFLSYCNDKREKREIKKGVKEILDGVLNENLDKVKPELVWLTLKIQWLKSKIDNIEKSIKQGKEPDFDSFKDDCKKKFKLIDFEKFNWHLIINLKKYS